MPDAAIQADFSAMGVAIDLPASATRPDPFGVWPENWAAVRAFLVCETQWRVIAGQGPLIWLGLDYTAVDAVLRRQFPDAPPEVFEDIRTMEAEAIAVFAEES